MLLDPRRNMCLADGCINGGSALKKSAEFNAKHVKDNLTDQEMPKIPTVSPVAKAGSAAGRPKYGGEPATKKRDGSETRTRWHCHIWGREWDGKNKDLARSKRTCGGPERAGGTGRGRQLICGSPVPFFALLSLFPLSSVFCMTKSKSNMLEGFLLLETPTGKR